MAKKPREPQKVNTKKFVARKQQEEKQVKTAIIVASVILAMVLVLVAYVLIDRYIIKPNVTVASVGDTNIKAGEFEVSAKYTRLNMLNQATQYINFFGEQGKEYALPLLLQLQDPDIVGESVLNQLIDEVIIREEAEKRGITVSDAELEQELRDQFRFYPEGTLTPTITSTPVYTPTWSATQFALINPTDTPEPSPTPTETPEGWLPTATDLPEGVTPEPTATAEPTIDPNATATPVPTDLPTATPYTERLYNKDVREYLDSLNPYGISKSDVERIIYMGLLRDKLMQDVTKDLKPEEEQVWVRHILVEDEETALDVIKRIEDGEEWQLLAAEYSTDESNKDNGGDLGWIGLGDSYDQTFLEVSFALGEDGEVSKPINTQFGWHIIQLVTKATNPINSSKFSLVKQTFFTDWLAETRLSREDIVIEPVWTEFAPSTPAVPQDLYNYVITQGG